MEVDKWCQRLEHVIPCMDLVHMVLSFDLAYVCHTLPLTLEILADCTPEMISYLWQHQLRSWIVPWLFRYIYNKACNLIQQAEVLHDPCIFDLSSNMEDRFYLHEEADYTSLGTSYTESIPMHRTNDIENNLYLCFLRTFAAQGGLGLVTLDIPNQKAAQFLYEHDCQYEEDTNMFKLCAAMVTENYEGYYRLELTFQWNLELCPAIYINMLGGGE